MNPGGLGAGGPLEGPFNFGTEYMFVLSWVKEVISLLARVPSEHIYTEVDDYWDHLFFVDKDLTCFVSHQNSGISGRIQWHFNIL